MRSHLTRKVFQSLLSNEPLLFRCPRSLSLVHQNYVSPAVIRGPIRRTLFGFSQKQPREPKPPQLDPGLDKLLELNHMEKIGARAPDTRKLRLAWLEFLTYKEKRGEPLNNIQAQHALRTFKHLRKVFEQGDDEANLTSLDMKYALRILVRMPNDSKETHQEFARELYEEIRRKDGQSGYGDTSHYVAILTQTGSSFEARQFVKSFWGTEKRLRGQGREEKHGRDSWIRVIEGFGRENNEEELLRTVKMMEELRIPYTSAFHQVMTEFYASRDDVANTKKWFSEPTQNHLLLPETLSTIIQFTIRNNELAWSKSIFRQLLEINPSKEIWDIILQWAAGAMGKGVEDVERMMGVMADHNGIGDKRPDIDTINGLVKLAMSRNDSYLAERYIALGLKHGIRCNAETFILQMTCRLSAGDLLGAQKAYKSLQSCEILDNADLPAINSYIRALCATKSPNHDLITSIITDLDERSARLEASTVASLCLLYLHRQEIDDLVDTLQSNTYHYTLTERASIRDTLLSYTLSPDTTTPNSWEAYQILRQIFDETTREIRTTCMEHFFRRGRSDMALHVFGHMRAHPRSDKRPVLSTYTSCFLGLASTADAESLNIVHNMLKMDSSIEPNTQLWNSLMLAYTECGDAWKAVGFWDEITGSKEGPSYRSLEIVFGACRRYPFGDVKAREIWRKMRKMEIEITQEVFIAYVAALAGQGKFEDAKGMVESAEKELGLKVDVLTLGTFYNALPGQNRKDLVEQWANELYSDVWAELVKLGQIEAKEGHRLFKLPKGEMRA